MRLAILSGLRYLCWQALATGPINSQCTTASLSLSRSLCREGAAHALPQTLPSLPSPLQLLAEHPQRLLGP